MVSRSLRTAARQRSNIQSDRHLRAIPSKLLQTARSRSHLIPALRARTAQLQPVLPPPICLTDLRRTRVHLRMRAATSAASGSAVALDIQANHHKAQVTQPMPVLDRHTGVEKCLQHQLVASMPSSMIIATAVQLQLFRLRMYACRSMAFSSLSWAVMITRVLPRTIVSVL